MEVNNTQMLRGLYGSHIKRNKAVGYCYFHKCHLTATTLKGHQCLSKNCSCFKKHEDNDYWKQREELKALKKMHRMSGDNIYAR